MMKFLRNRSLSAAFWMTQIALVAACAIGLAALAVQQRALQWVVHTREVREQLERVSALLTTAETAQRSYLLTRDARGLQALREAVADVPPELGRLGTLIDDNAAQRQALASLRGHVDARLAQLLAAGESPAADEPATAADNGRELMQAIRQDVRGMLDAESALLDIRERRAQRYRTMGWGAVGMLGGLSIALVWFLRRAAVRELRLQGRNQQVLESLPQLVWTCTPEGEANYLSRQWLD